MAYDPFERGEITVGVRTGELHDEHRDRRLPFEVWYPAGDVDRDVRAGRHPLVVYSHSSGGHRRQSSSLCSHLASRGYVVAAADHVGNTAADAAERAARIASGRPFTQPEIDAYVDRIIGDRVPDIRALLDETLRGDLRVSILAERIGLVGYSFGGWAVLATPQVDDRARAIVALAPGGNSKPLPGIIPAQLSFSWRREVATLYLVGDRDRFTPLAGQFELLDRTPGQARMFVLEDADHGHFADDVRDPGVSAGTAHQFTRGLTLAHFDATLKERGDAEAFLAHAADALRERGIAAREEHRGGRTRVG